MEAAGSSSLLTFPSNAKTLCKTRLIKGSSKSAVNLGFIKKGRLTARIAAINDVPAAADPGQVGVTWQIVVGAIAGVTPFVVAGIEFSKRILACV
uniref:Uncharacterized protein LOC8277583 n=1 Tax=Rhizophora mucronata TaxID=61149 RepID=A0A2P2JJ45_RHIMU